MGVALSIFMVYLTVTTIQKGCKLYSAESEENEKLASEESLKTATPEEERLLVPETDTLENTLTAALTVNPSLSNESELTKSIEQVAIDEAETKELDQIVENEKTECGQWSS